MRAYLEKLVATARVYYRAYPAVCNSVLASAVVYVAARLGFVVDKQSALSALAYALPIILLGGVKTHRKVKPL